MEIGQKVKWTIGKADNPVNCKGIFYHDTEEGKCLVNMVQRGGMPYQLKVEIEKSNLQYDGEQII